MRGHESQQTVDWAEIKEQETAHSNFDHSQIINHGMEHCRGALWYAAAAAASSFHTLIRLTGLGANAFVWVQPPTQSVGAATTVADSSRRDRAYGRRPLLESTRSRTSRTRHHGYGSVTETQSGTRRSHHVGYPVPKLAFLSSIAFLEQQPLSSFFPLRREYHARRTRSIQYKYSIYVEKR